MYNENLRDLLKTSENYLDLREDPVKGMCVAGVSEVSGLKSAQEILDLLHKGNQNRTTEPTQANVVSSRSHAVLQVTVEQCERSVNTVQEVRSRPAAPLPANDSCVTVCRKQLSLRSQKAWMGRPGWLAEPRRLDFLRSTLASFR